MSHIRRTGRVPNFEWEKRDEFDKGVSGYKRFSIQVESPYKWGSGWTETDKLMFYSELKAKISEHSALQDLSFKEGNDSGTSPSLVGKRFSDKTSIYLHPMEFSGYATDEVVGALFDVLNSMSERNVQSSELSYKKDVSGMSDLEYKRLLLANVANIARWQDAMADAGYSIYDYGDKFAASFRIPRVGDGACLSSSDLDWSFVQDLALIREGLKDYEKVKESSLEENDMER